ncbi:MAG: hypothetical protein KC619_32130 [Myxococcales bacterium]|nr:hypothetical protein [Myxococcales bacterium]
MTDISDLEALAWLEPWELLPKERRPALERELRRELCAEHVLFGRDCVAVASRGDRDDVLFLVDGAQLVVVHLTWNEETDPGWPSTHRVADLDAFEVEMKRDNEGFLDF